MEKEYRKYGTCRVCGKQATVAKRGYLSDHLLKWPDRCRGGGSLPLAGSIVNKEVETRANAVQRNIERLERAVADGLCDSSESIIRARKSILCLKNGLAFDVRLPT